MTKKLITLFITLVSVTMTAMAGGGGPTFYYKYHVEPATTGGGKVYASTEDTLPDDKYYRESAYATVTNSQGTEVNVQAVTVTAYLFAKANDGYMFTHWTRVEDDKETIFSNSKNTTDLVTTTATTFNDPKIAYYKAYFAKIGLVYPVSSDESLGTVTITKADNTIGDEVTIEAIPDLFNGKFIGWKRNQSTDLIKERSITMKVSHANKGTYTAVFESKGIEKGIYVMMENVGTNRMMGVTGTSENTLSKDQRYFMNSIMLMNSKHEKIHSTPANILRLTGKSTGTGGLTTVEMIGQGISTYDIGNLKFRVEKYKENDFFVFGMSSGFTGYMKDNSDKVTTQEELIGTVNHPGLYNRAINDARYRWKFHIINEENFDENYFGAMPEATTTQNGKYYTTMYTTFPYECRDGVKAYIVDKIQGNKAHLIEINKGRVHSRTPVILECNSTKAIENRLMPLVEEPDGIGTTNLLRGEIWLNDESGDEANYRTAFDPATMRILGSTGKACFASQNIKDGTKTLQYIANNTCYLDVSGIESPAEEIILNIEEDQEKLLGDANGDGKINVTDVMHIVSYILGNHLNVFIEKNADFNESGKIDVVDAMLVVNYILTNND